MSYFESMLTKLRAASRSAARGIPKRTLLTFVLPLCLFVIGLQIISLTPSAQSIDQKIFHPLVFQVRERIKPQKLDPRIKIFLFDNRTVSYLKSQDIPLETWGLLIEELSKKEGVRIVISKLFDATVSDEQMARFAEIMKNTKTKTGIQAFTYPGEISYRQPISADLIKANEKKTITSKDNLGFFSPFKTNKTPYGAPPGLLSSFSVFGHNEYSSNNRSKPIIVFNDNSILPNTALTMADDVRIAGNEIRVNGHNVNLSRNGDVLVNFASKNIYQKSAYSLLAAIERAKQSRDISVVNPGDYVVILPGMYTGSTDFQETPFGPMPGGYTLLALLQSVLTGQWLSEVNDYGATVLLLGVLGFFIGTSNKPRLALLYLLAASIAVVCASIALFVSAGIAWSFVLPLVSLIVSGLTGVIVHSSLAGIEEMRIQRELEVATLVQKSFFPQATNRLTGRVSVDGGFIPASECGGDWWGCFKKNGYTYVLIGDAVGHGVPAALVTAVAFSVTRTIDLEMANTQSGSLSPGKILSDINQVLCDMSSELACMTFMVFRIDDATGTCVFANAANPQPVLLPIDANDDRLSKGQLTKTLLARGDVLGLSRDSTFTEHTMALRNGDRLVLYTDGLVENESEKSQKPLGKVWLKQQLNQLATQHGDTFAEGLWSRYHSAVGNAKPADDVTVVVISLSNP